MKKKNLKKLIVGLMAVSIISLCVHVQSVKAYDFEGNESTWIKRCSQVLTDRDTYNACLAFQQYAKDKANSYNNSASDMQSKIEAAQGNLDALVALGKDYAAQLEVTAAEIQTIENAIVQAKESIRIAEENIKEKEENIEKRNEIIRKQMIGMQAEINTNQFIDFIMGAVDLVEMVQRSNSIETVTKSQKEQIKKLNEEKAELKLAKDDQVRIKEGLDDQQVILEATRMKQEVQKQENDNLVKRLNNEIEVMLAARNEANSAASTLANMRPPSFSTGGGSADLGDINSSGLLRPINAPISCGVGCYDGHRGVDFAAGWGTPVVAPADSYVVFATNIFTNDSGYNLGNMEGPAGGAPSGGGNSVRIIFSVNGQTYAMNIHHMTTNMPAVSYNGTGQVVPQGTVLGHVGSSGNSTGAHAHVEMFTLSGSVQQEVARWYSNGDWQSGCGWGQNPVCVNGSCRVNPANYF